METYLPRLYSLPAPDAIGLLSHALNTRFTRAVGRVTDLAALAVASFLVTSVTADKLRVRRTAYIAVLTVVTAALTVIRPRARRRAAAASAPYPCGRRRPTDPTGF